LLIPPGRDWHIVALVAYIHARRVPIHDLQPRIRGVQTPLAFSALFAI
jgi:hypothetical protein